MLPKEPAPSSSPEPSSATAPVLPAFDANGNLPPGDYWPSESEFQSRFVSVTNSSTRTSIYEGFKRHRVALQTAMVDARASCLLNGSFTTSKIDPGDIDLVVEVDGNLFNSSPQLKMLLSGPKAKPQFNCDAYPLLVYPPNHPYYASATLKGREYWCKWFAKDRNNNAKGRVWASVGGFR